MNLNNLATQNQVWARGFSVQPSRWPKKRPVKSKKKLMNP
jgi:hypothetical protein